VDPLKDRLQNSCYIVSLVGASGAAAVLLSMLSLLISPHAIGPPHLPKQSAIQAAAVQRAEVSAGDNAAAGVQSLLSTFGSSAFKAWLSKFDDGSRLDLLDPNALLHRVEQELSIAEMVHNFGVTRGQDGNCGMDVSLSDGVGQPYFYNQWLLQALGLVPVDPDENKYAEGAETQFWGFPPFANVSAPDVPTAADRPVYSALNMYRIAAGNPQCGPVSAVFSRAYVGSQAIASPVDTGNYFILCGQGQTSGTVLPNVTIDCTAWNPRGGELGVPTSLVHLLPGYARFYNETSVVAGAQFAEFNLARLVVRLLSRRTYRDADADADATTATAASPLIHSAFASRDNDARRDDVAASAAPLRLNFFEDTWGYLELNAAVTITQPGGIKMLVGTFDNWFGADEGSQLREWCVSRGWPLAWAHDPIDSTWQCSVNTTGGCQLPPRWTYTHGVSPSNARFLDPYVLRRVPHGFNSTGGGGFAAAEAAFTARWKLVNTTVPSSLPLPQRRKLMDAQWRALLTGRKPIKEEEEEEEEEEAAAHMNASPHRVGLAGSELAIEPLFWGACADTECVGVRIIDGACVCSPPDAERL
jgi:hypothetical protein